MKAGNDTIDLKMTPTGWQMSKNLGSWKGHGDYPRIDVNFGDTDQITFNIKTNGILFAPKVNPSTNSANPFCAQAGPKPVTACSGPFDFPSGGGTQLIVTDNNDKTQEYNYVLNFQNGVPQLDPIINNGGKSVAAGIPRSPVTMTEAAAFIFVLLVILFFASRRYRSPQQTTKGP